MTTADFDMLVAQHSDFLHPYAISLTNDRNDAKDLYQETVLRALLNRDKYRFGTNLKAWLYTIMRNIFINNYRRSRKFIIIPYDTGTTVADRHVMNNGWSNLRMSEIRRAIDNLPDVFRLSFELYCAGYKYQEISEVLQEPLGTVKSRIHFARKKLMTQSER